MTVRANRLKRKSTVRRKGDPIPWKYCLLTMVCGLFLVAGFFYAARQHFASMEYRMENTKLRKQIKELEAEKNRHKLAREIALSPAEINKSAKKLGLRKMTAKNIEAVKSKKSEKNTPDKTKKSKQSAEVKKEAKSEKKKTVDKKKENKKSDKKSTNKKPERKNSQN